MNHKIHFVEKFCQFMSFLYYPVPHISFFLSLHWTFETTINILLLMTLPKQFSTALMWLLCWEPLLLCLMAWKKDKDRRKGKGRRICLGGKSLYLAVLFVLLRAILKKQMISSFSIKLFLWNSSYYSTCNLYYSVKIVLYSVHQLYIVCMYLYSIFTYI